ncbi:replication terminator protein [Priestia megaterium]|jgi:hypothetical protein|uniref:replication terminator protein n=1 Tax=Priestia megaterium TaxID=1404 RepID=UPI00406BC211
MIDLNQFAKGKLAEQLNDEIQRVIENIADMNTDENKARKISVTLTFKSDRERKVLNVAVQTKSTLAPPKEIDSKLVLNYDNEDISAAELQSGVPGQTYIDYEGDPATDTGEKINH